MQTKFLKTRFVNLKTKRAMGISYCLKICVIWRTFLREGKKVGGRGEDKRRETEKRSNLHTDAHVLSF